MKVGGGGREGVELGLSLPMSPSIKSCVVLLTTMGSLNSGSGGSRGDPIFRPN